MEKPVVALQRYEKSPDSLSELIRVCKGFSELKSHHHVFIKPNLVALDDKYPMAFYGVYTTTRMVLDMVLLLKDFGVGNITVGEGSARGKDFGVSTEGIYKALGYPSFAARYGVRLVDLLSGPFEKVDFGDFSLEIAKPALEADFLINMPVLKTHNQAVVSLGLKNLKGCLSIKSRKFCHSANELLDDRLSLFVEKLRPALTVLDGIYGLEKGPFYLGSAVRMNALAASKDPLAVDVMGAALAGIDPADVPHLRKYAERHGRSLRPDSLELRGTPLKDLAKPLKWDNTWNGENTGPRVWERMGVQGISLPKYDKTLCTGCSGLYGPILAMVMLGYRGEPYSEIEILTGKAMKPSGKAKKTFLLGNCMIKLNRRDPAVTEAVPAKGCPPSLEEVFSALGRCGIPVDPETYRIFRNSLADKYKGKEEFDESLFYIQKEPDLLRGE